MTFLIRIKIKIDINNTANNNQIPDNDVEQARKKHC